MVTGERWERMGVTEDGMAWVHMWGGGELKTWECIGVIGDTGGHEG